MREEIHAAATDALNGGIMDEVIYDGDLLESLASRNGVIQEYLDIPIRDLIALRQRDFYTTGSTWRDAALGLHCSGWEEFREKIVHYFVSDLRDNPFPAPNSSQELRVGFTGGAIYCKLGNHRAVAAKAWLASKHNEDEVFRKAKCYFYSVSDPLKKLMTGCLKNGSKLKHAYVPFEHEGIRNEGIFDLIIVENKSSACDLYSLDTETDCLDPIFPSKNPIARLLRNDLRSKCLRLEFKTVPPRLIKLIINDEKTSNLLKTNQIEG